MGHISNRLDSPTEITRSDVDQVVKTLVSNNAYMIMDYIEGADKFGTAPVRDAYFALGNTNLIGQLDAVSGFISKNQYPSPMNALPSELIKKNQAHYKFLVIDLEAEVCNVVA